MNKTKKPIIWTISGADCSGGAGIAADIKTAHGLGVEICHLITANTVQNSTELIAVNPVTIELLQQQVDALYFDKAPSVIKIGLVANTEQVIWLITTIQTLKVRNPRLIIVYDPVGQASVGGKFSDISHLERLRLVAICDVLTPNLSEAQQLSGEDNNDVKAHAQKLLETGLASIIIKGGHLKSEHSSDYCLHSLNTITQDSTTNKATTNKTIEYQLKSPRINTSYSHGGGCTFATALSSFLAHGYLLRDAFTLTKALINQGLSKRAGELEYYGAFEQGSWPKNADNFPQICAALNQQYSNLPAFPSLTLTNKLGLYPVVDSTEWLKRLLPLNLNIIQLRLKNKTNSELNQIIAEAVAISRDYPTRLFINDYWKLAIKHNAYGVHIGQEDLQNADLAIIQQAGLRLGISTHGCYEFLLAQQLKPSYLAVGAIFPTKTKDMTGQIQGIDNLVQLLNLSNDIPVVAIGGINLERAQEVWRTGVDSIAVVTAITETSNYQLAVQNFQKITKNN